MNAVLKYYKLLFTLPREELLYCTAIVATAYLLLSHKVLTVLSLALFWILFYEERVLNAKRLSALTVAISLASSFGKPALAAVFMALAAALYSPSPLAPLLAPTFLYLTSPFAIVSVLPIALVLAYGKRKGTATFGIYWLRAWMGDDYYPLEKFIHENGIERRAKLVKVGPILFTDAHFGLMRYTMGALVPHLFAVNGHVPHRLCGSHENNPASRWEAYKLLRAIMEAKGEVEELKILEGNGVRVFEYRGPSCVAIVEHEDGADDLPCVEWGCEIADPHNSEGERPEAERLLSELGELREVERLKLRRPLVREVRVRGEDLCEERAYLIDWGAFKHLVVFGNNMKPGAREKVGVPLVSTVDDHSCAGFGRRTYEPCRVDSFVVLKERVASKEWAESAVTYKAMGEFMLSESSQKEIVKSIKLGLVAVALSLVLGLA